MIGDNNEQRCCVCGDYGPCHKLKFRIETFNPAIKKVVEKNICQGCVEEIKKL